MQTTKEELFKPQPIRVRKKCVLRPSRLIAALTNPAASDPGITPAHPHAIIFTYAHFFSLRLVQAKKRLFAYGFKTI